MMQTMMMTRLAMLRRVAVPVRALRTNARRPSASTDAPASSPTPPSGADDATADSEGEGEREAEWRTDRPYHDEVTRHLGDPAKLDAKTFLTRLSMQEHFPGLQRLLRVRLEHITAKELADMRLTQDDLRQIGMLHRPERNVLLEEMKRLRGKTPHDRGTQRQLVEATLQLGTEHLHRNENDEALKLFLRAVEKAEEALGPRDRDTARALTAATELQIELDNYVEAAELAHRLVATRRALAKDADPRSADELATALRLLGNALTAVEEYDEAFEALNEAVSTHTADVDKQRKPALILNMHEDMGDLMLNHMEDPQQALRIYRRLLKVHDHQDADGFHPVHTASLRRRAGLAHMQMGNYQKADHHFRTGLGLIVQYRDAQTKANEPLEKEVLHEQYELYNSLGHALRELNLPARSRVNFDKALQCCFEAHGTDHTLTSDAYFNLAVAHALLRDEAAARQQAEHALRILIKTEGNDHAKTESVREFLDKLHETIDIIANSGIAAAPPKETTTEEGTHGKNTSQSTPRAT